MAVKLSPALLIALVTLGLLGGFVLAGWTARRLIPPALSQPLLLPRWSSSYRLYQQPHAVWLANYERPGCNLPALEQALAAAKKARQIPELVIYSIPLRDLGESSEGGFATYEDYEVDNRLNAAAIRQFAQKTGLRPVIYLEPDSLSMAVQYRRDRHDDETSRRIYAERVRMLRRLIDVYRDAGAAVYLEAAHSGWFDYDDASVQRIADALNDAGIEQADGLITNVSNRQPAFIPGDETARTEWHYLGRLLPRLKNRHLDVRVDTSRNGGPTHARQYYLDPDGRLWDNEFSGRRLVGRWVLLNTDDAASATPAIRLEPFFGPSKTLARLLRQEKYTYDAAHRLLTAPAWLDAVGDVQPGPPPTDSPPAQVASRIGHYRYIKPPDECDGALNYPPGVSKHRVNEETRKRQPAP